MVESEDLAFSGAYTSPETGDTVFTTIVFTVRNLVGRSGFPVVSGGG